MHPIGSYCTDVPILVLFDAVQVTQTGIATFPMYWLVSMSHISEVSKKLEFSVLAYKKVVNFF